MGMPTSFAGEQNNTTPTEFVELPTKGKLYPPDHPLHGKEEVEIRYMTSKDEDILSSQVLLQKGLMLDRFIHNVLVDKTINPQELYAGDRNAILVAARITGYGPEYQTNVTCPACKQASRFDFDLSEYGIRGLDATEELGLTLTENGTYCLELPKTKVIVEIKILDGKSEKYLAEFTATKKKNNLPESPVTDLLKIVTVSINGDNTRSKIDNFVDNLPAFDSRHLRRIYSKINPNIDLTKPFTCPKCKAEADMEVPLTAEFFWAN